MQKNNTRTTYSGTRNKNGCLSVKISKCYYISATDALHSFISCVFFLFGALTSNKPSLFLHPDLLEAVEEVLPSLKEQGSRVFILREHCNVEGIESLSDKIQQESDEPLSPHLRANITLKSPALYIYTSGTTGNPAFTSNLAFLVGVLTLIYRLSTMKIFYSQQRCYL